MLSETRPAALDEIAPKRFRAGTHRTIAPAETLRRMQPLLPRLGITRLANVTGLDRIGLPVVICCRPNSRSLAVSQGKGLDLDAAKASALMESVEAFHAERIALPLLLASYAELRRSRPVVDVDVLPRPASSLFHPDLPMLWIEGYDLIQRVSVWLPYELVHTNFTLPPPGHGSFHCSSNGLASGNHLLEALSHAVCEVVERDATALWDQLLQAEQRATRVDPGSVNDPDCCRVLELFARAGVAVAVWEQTSDIGLPAFLCTIVDAAEDRLHPVQSASGMGCHPVREVALLRALTEAAQSRLTDISGTRDDVFRDEYDRLHSPDRLARDRALLTGSTGARRFSDAPTFACDSFNDDVALELERLQAVGVRSAVLIDLSSGEFQTPVVRVVIPGLAGPFTPASSAARRQRAQQRQQAGA